ncbi:MAG: hypothetical protein ACI8PZ_000470 [Myxococcota bacterium]|jgi:hypothetical protein
MRCHGLILAFLFTGCADGLLDPSAHEDTAAPGHMYPANPHGEGPALPGFGSDEDALEGALRARRVGPSSPLSYTLLAQTAITNVTGSAVTDGNLGLSPAAGSYITGFSLVADPSNHFATSSSVVPPSMVLAANYASPTPSVLTTAIGRMQTAYTTVAGMGPPDFLDLSSGNIGGLVLAPGLYTWSSSVTVPTDVTLSGGPGDTWIMQILNDLDVSAGQNILLAGGASAKNIIRQVAGQVTIHENADFEGVILSNTAVTLQTNASLHGRAFAQTQIALDDNAVTAP